MRAKPTRWERLRRRLHNSVIGVMALSGLAVLLYVSNGLAALERLAKWINPPAPVLLATPLSGANAPRLLDGYEVLDVKGDADRASAVFPRGARITFDLAHSHGGDATITVRGIKLDIDRFVPGTNAQYAYAVRPERIYGAGTAKPHVFHVALFGSKAGPAMRMTDSKSSTAMLSRSDNFLDTDNPIVLKLTKHDDRESIDVIVTAEEPGLYEISFTAFYSTLANVKQLKIGPSVRIYYDGS